LIANNIDAFSGGTIPVHLLTKEAFGVYLERLEGDNGIIAVHITNKHLNFIPLLGAYGATQSSARGFSCY